MKWNYNRVMKNLIMIILTLLPLSAAGALDLVFDDGKELSGEILGQVPFKTPYGNLTIPGNVISDFTTNGDKTVVLSLKDGTVLKGNFLPGKAQFQGPKGKVDVNLQSVVRLGFDPLLGTWEGKFQNQTISFIFKKDGKVTMAVDKESKDISYKIELVKGKLYNMDLILDGAVVKTIIELQDSETFRMMNSSPGEDRPGTFDEEKTLVAKRTSR